MVTCDSDRVRPRQRRQCRIDVDGQRALEEQFECVFLTRSGYPPGPPLERIDFDEQADEVAAELREGDHLVGHSYGGVVSLLAAAARKPVLASLTVSEPPAFGVARGDPAVEEFSTVRHFRETTLRRTPARVPRVLPAARRQRVNCPIRCRRDARAGRPGGARRAVAGRGGDPVRRARRGSLPEARHLRCGHHACVRRRVRRARGTAGRERERSLPGAGHSLPRAPGYNETLVSFIQRAS